jgi:hypothetical protein
VACKTAGLSQAGSTVRISPSAPVDHGFDPRSCTSLGYLVGRGGGSFGGGYISNDDLIAYAMNDLRNQAAALGANYVQHDTPQLGSSGGTAGGGSMTTSTATVSGSAYSCTTQSTAPQATSPVAEALPPRPSSDRADRAAPDHHTESLTTKTAEGHKDLRIRVTAVPVSLLLRAVPARSSDVSLYAQLNREAAPDDCELLLASGGARVELSSPPSAAGAGRGEWGSVRALLALDALSTALSADRVVGRVCEHEFVLTAGDLTALRDYVLRVRETAALLPAPQATTEAGDATNASPNVPAAGAASP